MSIVADCKAKYKAFRAWQHRPYTVAPLSAEQHDCLTCGTHYQGNYCPRCGQSAKIGRYSFKKAFLLFIDVWGIGNRGMFRSLRDLVLRPGYMIRDYLSGMQMAYFPPFKMLFLLTTVSILFNVYGINIHGEKWSYEQEKEKNITMMEEEKAKKNDPVDKEYTEKLWNGFTLVEDITEKYPGAVALSSVVFFTLFLYPFFRKSKAIPSLSFPEFLIAMVFIANMQSIYEIVMRFFCIKSASEYSLFMTVIPMKQLSGFSWLRTILSMISSVLIMAILIIVILVAFIIINFL